MNYTEQIFNYLKDIGEESAAQIILNSEFREKFEDCAGVGDDIYAICSFQILVEAKYFSKIETEYLKEKGVIAQTLEKFALSEDIIVRHVSWLPLQKNNSVIAKINQNDKLKKSLVEGNYIDFFDSIKSFFASMSYDMKISEGYFHSNIHMLLKVIGFEIVSEDETNIGRIDCVIELEDKIIIIEFKTSTPELALAQIEKKKYYEKYLIKNKKIHLLGVSCSLVERNISDWRLKELNSPKKHFNHI